MAKIIPGVYTDVRAVGLATSQPFGLNIVGIIGTAERGPVDAPTLVTSKQDMYDIFGEPGEYITTDTPEGSEKTLVRSGALAFDGGTQQIQFIRIGSSNIGAATRYITADDGSGLFGGYCAALEAVSSGSWGNNITYKVETADGDTSVAGHVAAVGASVENVFDDTAAYPGSYIFDTYAGTNSPATLYTGGSATQFTYLNIPSADSFIAVASPTTRVELQRSADDNYQRTTFDAHHTDAGFLKISGEVSPTETLTSTASEQYVQSFWTIDGFNIQGSLMRLKQSSAVGNVILNLYLADSDSRPTGSVLATSTTLDASTIDASFETVEMLWSTSYVLQPQTEYCLVLEDTLSAGTVTWGGEATDVFTQGMGQFYNGTSWSVLTGVSDLYFQPIYDIPENHCIFVINDWSTSFIAAYTKKIIWSEVTDNAPDSAEDTLYFEYETATSMKFTLKYNETQEVYYVVDGYDLINDINDTIEGSILVDADETAYGSNDYPDRAPLQTSDWQSFGVGAGEAAGTATIGNDGSDVSAADYSDGLDLMLNVEAHIIICAGQYSPTVHTYLQSHCNNASNDMMERVGVCGHRHGLTLTQIQSSSVSLSSKRMIFVSPGVITVNHATGLEETVSAAYTASILAGYMASINPSVSPLNKGVPVGGLESEYNNAELEQLIKRKINPIKVSRRGGYRWAKADTTATDSSWQKIPTVRITDYATIGIRLACEPFIGEKNLLSKRNSTRTSVSSFMENMKIEEMLDDESSYTVEIISTREERIQGLLRVNVSFRPTFAIEYIMVTQYVE